jgi:hypothetical protein
VGKRDRRGPGPARGGAPGPSRQARLSDRSYHPTYDERPRHLARRWWVDAILWLRVILRLLPVRSYTEPSASNVLRRAVLSRCDGGAPV